MTHLDNILQPRTTPTMYFIGVTTTQSSIMKVFPKWSAVLGLEAELVGIDLPLDALPTQYRQVIEHIKAEPQVAGALVTTHKINLFRATRDLFDSIDEFAELCHEVSAISKQDGKLFGHAKDPLTSGMAWEAFIPPEHFRQWNAQVLCFGAGGSGVAISVYLAQLPLPPAKLTLVDIDESRLAEAEATHAQLDTNLAFEYVLSTSTENNDALLSSLPDGSVVINATGMGKDRPGSPITDAGIFPKNGFAWEFNYRGVLNFLHQARVQAPERNLHVDDGWIYFLHGWSQVIAEVFHFDLTPALFQQLDEAASFIRG